MLVDWNRGTHPQVLSALRTLRPSPFGAICHALRPLGGGIENALKDAHVDHRHRRNNDPTTNYNEARRPPSRRGRRGRDRTPFPRAHPGTHHREPLPGLDRRGRDRVSGVRWCHGRAWARTHFRAYKRGPGIRRSARHPRPPLGRAGTSSLSRPDEQWGTATASRLWNPPGQNWFPPMIQSVTATQHRG